MLFQGNFKIQGARVTYDIYSMMLLLRDTTFRCEREEKVNIVNRQMTRVMMDLFPQKRCQVEAEVKYLRDAISQLKVSISTITKGVSMSKIEVNLKD